MLETKGSWELGRRLTRRYSSWMDVGYRARIFAALTDFGYGVLVIRYWRRHRTEIERDPDLWAQTCRALTELDRKREARELLATWHERPGVDMWIVANYVNCFSSLSPKHLEAVRSACAQALGELHHDHCARYLAHVQAEACALLGDTEGFLETWNEHRGYFDGECGENEWFHDRRTHLLTDIPKIVGFLEQNERWAYRKSLWRLRWENAWRAPSSSLLVQGMKRVHIVIWWLLFIGILAILANLKSARFPSGDRPVLEPKSATSTSAGKTQSKASFSRSFGGRWNLTKLFSADKRIEELTMN